MKRLTLGLLPAAGGGLASLAASGQAGRLIDYYFPAYLKTFDHLFYFSYQQEKLTDYTDDTAIVQGVSLVSRLRRSPYRVYAFQLPFVARLQFEACGALRVFQATGAVPAMIAHLMYGIPYVTTYGYRYHALAAVEGRRLSSLYLRLLEPLTLRLAAGVIVTTQELASYMERFIPAARIYLIPNGVDTALFAPSEQTRSEKNGVTTILFVGRLTRQKNLARLLEALSVLTQRYAIRLQIIGAGPLQGELEAAAARLQVDCAFESTVPHHTLPSYMNRADIFVLPSLVEGHPKVLIEALSCGLPCVVSACEGNRAVVEHERTGLLFDPFDIADMVVQLERVISDDNLARDLSRAARQQALAAYDLNRLLDKEVSVLLATARSAGREDGSQ
jgi:glycosyltransferase involved in cell wall biosynthesis